MTRPVFFSTSLLVLLSTSVLGQTRHTLRVDSTARRYSLCVPQLQHGRPVSLIVVLHPPRISPRALMRRGCSPLRQQAILVFPEAYHLTWSCPTSTATTDEHFLLRLIEHLTHVFHPIDRVLIIAPAEALCLAMAMVSRYPHLIDNAFRWRRLINIPSMPPHAHLYPNAHHHLICSCLD